MKKSDSKLIDSRFERIIEEKAYISIFAFKMYELYLKYGNILSKKAIKEFDEFTDFNKGKRKSINVLVWETDKVYKDKEIKYPNVWVNDEYEGFPQIITNADITNYVAKTKCLKSELYGYLAEKGFRVYGKIKPYKYHPQRLHFFKSIGLASEWIAEDIHSKTGKYYEIETIKSKISEIINTSEESKVKRYKYKGYIIRRI